MMNLFYRKYGSGPPLIILHGLYGSSDNWVTIAKKISSNFTVYLPDLRNHGQSPHSMEHNYESLSSDIHDFAVKLGLRKFFLAGHSMGGKTAIQFAISWPEMLWGLLIADISPFSDDTEKTNAFRQHHTILHAIAACDLSAAGSRNEIDKGLSAEIPSQKVRDLIMKNINRTESGQFKWRLNFGALLDNLDNIVGALPVSVEGDLRITGFPVIFLKGERSEYINPDNFRKITRIFPSAELKIIKNAGHWLNADNPEEVTAALLNLGSY